MITTVLMIPGLGNSGPDHWQTLWEAVDPSIVRIRVADWDRPVCTAWVNAIDGTLRDRGGSAVVVAHSLGCLVFAHWAAQRRPTIRGAMLVAVPDPDGPDFPREAEGFSPLPLARLPCRSIIVSSQDDPYGGPQFAKTCANVWGSTIVDIGRAGHINGASGLGRWSRGLELLNALRSSPSA